MKAKRVLLGAWVVGGLVAGSTLVSEVGVVGVAAAHAQEYQLAYEVDQRLQEGGEGPRFRFQSPLGLKRGSVEIRRRGWSHEEPFEALGAGQWREVALEQPAGRYEYQVKIAGVDEAEREISYEVAFSVEVVEAISIEVLRQEVDLGRRHVPIRINRPVARLEIEIADEQGERFVRRTERYEGRYGEFHVSWEEAREVGEIQVTAHDVDGYWSSVRLKPYYVEIRHETIGFETGSATIREGEEPKLRAALEELRARMEEQEEEDEEMQLYIAGYTDTVGAAEDNLRLSERRARSLARWFQEEGVEIPIYYQGFGQEVLVVTTGDETEEAQNRRAIYLLGNTPPPTSESFPWRDWRRMR